MLLARGWQFPGLLICLAALSGQGAEQGSAPGSAQAQIVYFVAPTGSDASGDGSADKPWATISGAAAALPVEGGTVIVREGVYKGHVRLARSFSGLAVFRAQNRYRVRLEADHTTTVSIQNAGNIELRGFDIRRSAPQTHQPVAMHIRGSRNVVLRDNLIHDSHNNDLVKINEESQNILILGNVFFNQEGQAGQHIDVNGCRDVTIRDNIFFNDFAGSGRTNHNDTNAYIVVKNSGAVPESRRVQIASNVFLNWEGGHGRNFVLIGEDGKPFHEAQDVWIENNLMIGNSANRMRAPFGVKGARDITFRNNTITGDLPSSAYAMRLNREGANPRNRNIRLQNNIWSDPTGTMTNFADGAAQDLYGVVLHNNLYWNGGAALPISLASFSYTADGLRLVADPGLALPQGIVLPRWEEGSFRSGAETVRKEFERLVRLYGTPHPAGGVLGRAELSTAPRTDILGRERGTAPDLGALQVSPDAPSSGFRLVLVPGEVVGGQPTALNQLILDQPAGPGAQVITLSSSAPGLVTTPSEITIASGEQAATFRLDTAKVTSATDVSIQASTDQTTRAAALLIKPEGVRSLNLSSETLVAGMTSKGNRILLDGVAPAGGAAIALSSSRPDVVLLPSSLSAEENNSYSEAFAIDTRFVIEETVVTVTASWSGSSASTELMLVPPHFSLELGSRSMVAGATNSENQVVLDRVADAPGARVELFSSHPEAVSVPESVLVPAGRHIAAFPLVTHEVADRTAVTVSARDHDKTVSESLHVSPMRVRSLVVPAQVTGGTTPKGRVMMNGRSAEDVTVALSGTPSSVITVPGQVTIPAGSMEGPFQLDTAPVSQPQTATVRASHGPHTITADLQVEPPLLRSIYVASPLFGRQASVAVYLSGRTAAELPIQLESSDPSVLRVPSAVTLPVGESAVRLSAQLQAVSTPTEVRLTARLGESTVTAQTEVHPAGLSALQLSPAALGGGSSSAANLVRLQGVAPSGGAEVQLSSSSPAASVPPEVTIPEDAAFARFAVTAGAVSEPVEATISAVYGGETLAQTLTVTPASVTEVRLDPARMAGGVTKEGSFVRLTGSAPESGVTVSLSSSAPSVASVPSTVLVPAGATLVRFPITTSLQAQETSVAITASHGGQNQTAELTVGPPVPGVLVLFPQTVIGGAHYAGSLIQLNGPALAGGFDVALVSADPSLLSVPATVHIPEGEIRGRFAFSAMAVSEVKTIAVTATGGGASVTKELTVKPPE